MYFARFYNSSVWLRNNHIGDGWQTPWHRSLRLDRVDDVDDVVLVERPDGAADRFFPDGAGGYAADRDGRSRLHVERDASQAQIGWRLITADDVVERYSIDGRLLSLTARSGRVTTFTYSDAACATCVTEVRGPFGHRLRFAYDANGQVSEMTAPDGGVYRYSYIESYRLASVTYPDGSVRRYVYEDGELPGLGFPAPRLLIGIVDELGVRFATWTYDFRNRATSSQHAEGVDLTRILYGANTSTVTDARGFSHTFSFTTQFGLVKPISVSGAPV